MAGHKLDDNLLVTPALQRRLQAEAEFESGIPGRSWWCGAERSNGNFVAFEFGYTPEHHEKLIAEQIVKTLNREIDHDGAWVVQWTDGGTRFVMLWLDQDGDVQFAVDVDQDGIGMVEVPLLGWIEQAAEAWRLWHHHMRTVLAPTQDQLFKQAQGQKAPSIH